MTSIDLITQLQAARPVAGDDLRERVRAISSRTDVAARHLRVGGLSLRRLTAVAVPTTAVVALGIAGVTGFARSDAPATVAEASRLAATSPSQEAGDGAAAPGAESQAGTPSTAIESTPGPATGRAQRYSAQLAIEVKDTQALSAATQRALATTRELGGYVVTVSYASSDSGTATMTLRVPTTKVQEAIVRLSSLGTIVSQQVQIDDLQGQVGELAKREAALRTQIAKLSAQLARTDLDPAIRAPLQARRDAARAELVNVRATKTQVDAEASFATIQLGLSTPQASLVPPVPSRVDRALDEAGKILALEASVLLYGAAILLPPALLAVVAWYVVGVARRRGDERLLSAS